MSVRLFFSMCHCFCREDSDIATGSSRAHNHNMCAREQAGVECDERAINASDDETLTLNQFSFVVPNCSIVVRSLSVLIAQIK